MRLDRYHGLGNDYLVVHDGPPLCAALVRAVCDRHTGAGGDGILEPFATDEADHGIRIWNPDGSVAEKSGNGLRIAARWLVDTGRAGGRAFTISTGPCRVACEVRDADVRVAMGTASAAPADVPHTGDRPWIDHALELPDGPVRVTAVGLGNPHAVVFVDDDPDTVPWRTWGEALERHPAFPRRTNVQVARVRGPRVDVRVWERGAGPTQASGSSACGVVAAAVLSGRLQAGGHMVWMPGGTVHVAITAELGLTLTGPVQRIGRFDVDQDWLDTTLAEPVRWSGAPSHRMQAPRGNRPT